VSSVQAIGVSVQIHPEQNHNLLNSLN